MLLARVLAPVTTLRTISALSVAATILYLASCSETSDRVEIDADTCWPAVAAGQTVAGNARIYINSQMVTAYSPKCERNGAVLTGEAEALLGSELEALRETELNHPENYEAITIPAKISGKILSAPDGQSPVMQLRTLSRSGPIEVRRR